MPNRENVMRLSTRFSQRTLNLSRISFWEGFGCNTRRITPPQHTSISPKASQHMHQRNQTTRRQKQHIFESLSEFFCAHKIKIIFQNRKRKQS